MPSTNKDYIPNIYIYSCLWDDIFKVLSVFRLQVLLFTDD